MTVSVVNLLVLVLMLLATASSVLLDEAKATTHTTTAGHGILMDEEMIDEGK
jgi:hypothetical protein